MDMRCRVGWFTASTSMTLQHHFGTTVPQFSKNLPPTCIGVLHKDAPMRPSTAYQGAQTLYIYDMDMRCRVEWFRA